MSEQHTRHSAEVREGLVRPSSALPGGAIGGMYATPGVAPKAGFLLYFLPCVLFTLLNFH